MTKLNNYTIQKESDVLNKSRKPNLKLSKIGIIAHDYRESVGDSDFSKNMFDILKYLDEKGCDSVLFSLFTLLGKNSLTVESLNKFTYLKAVFIEEFSFQKNNRSSTIFKVYHKNNNCWDVYELNQKFATVKYTKKFKDGIISPFLKEVREKRNMGNCMILLCGETNIVKYSKNKKIIVDVFGIEKIIPPEIDIILNPVHDKMTRFEMKLKRKFFSNGNRIVISVWNKGKLFSDGKTRDGTKPPWTIYFNGKEIVIKKESVNFSNNDSSIDIGILDIEKEKRKIS